MAFHASRNNTGRLLGLFDFMTQTPIKKYFQLGSEMLINVT